jgi:hypothetical protein
MLYDGDMTDKYPEAEDAELQPAESASPSEAPREKMCGTFRTREALSKLPVAERLHYVELFGEVEELCQPIDWQGGNSRDASSVPMPSQANASREIHD